MFEIKLTILCFRVHNNISFTAVHFKMLRKVDKEKDEKARKRERGDEGKRVKVRTVELECEREGGRKIERLIEQKEEKERNMGKREE